MKYTAVFLFVLSGLTSFAQGLKFDDTKYNFGFVHEGELLVHEYKFENTGTQPVIISDAKVQCSCTKVEYPKQLIKPGEKGTIKVSFDTTNKMDRQDRTVLLVTNAQDEPYELRFKCIVLKPKKD
jgi:hypothetical protein